MGLGFKIPLGTGDSSSGSHGGSNLKFASYSDLNITNETTLNDLINILLNFSEDPFIAYISLDNQMTLKLSKDILKINNTNTDLVIYGNLICRVYNETIYFKYEPISREKPTEFFYSNRILSNKIKYITGIDDTKDNVVNFVSEDSETPIGWLDVELLTTGETHSSILNKISIMFNNIRYLKTLLGVMDTDIESLTEVEITEATEEEWDGSTSSDTTALSREEIINVTNK